MTVMPESGSSWRGLDGTEPNGLFLPEVGVGESAAYEQHA